VNLAIRSLFSDKMFYKNLFVIAVPIIIQNFINSLVNMMDTIMVGRIGTVEIAAVGLGNQLFFFYTIILFGVSSGGAVFTAQFWGKQDLKGIRRTTGLCLVIAVAISGLFTAASLWAPERLLRLYSRDPAVIAAGAAYLHSLSGAYFPFAVSFVLTLIMRSIERVRLPMMATVISLLVNVVLNYFLIFGIGPIPPLGVVGAAVATVIARWLELIILVTVAFYKKYALTGSFRELFGFRLPFVRRFFQIALPVMINELIWSAGITMQNIIFAQTSTEAIAAFSITTTVSQLNWVFFIGIGNAAGVLIGKKIGEGADGQARQYAFRIAAFAPLAAVVLGMLLIPLSWLLPYLFRVEAGVFTIISAMFVILALAYPFRAFNMSMIIGVCRAGGDTGFSVLYDVSFMWLFSIPLAALASFVFHVPAWLIYVCLAAEDPLKMFFGLWRLKTGKWLHNVTV